MGTNYYLHTPPCPNACEHCNISERIHLGKSSMGWRFTFQAQPDWTPDNAFANWLTLALNGRIEDEYGEPHTIAELLRLAHSKADERSHLEAHPDLRMNEIHDWYYASDSHEFCAREFS